MAEQPSLIENAVPAGPAGNCVTAGAERVFFARGHRFPIGRRTYVMGILNVTPDSFSDGGRYLSLDAALRQAERLVQGGADIIDIGGESTRPGYVPVGADEETARIVPVISAICERFPVPVSVDTYRARTAAAALAAGASIINDITGLRGDPDMAAVVASTDAGAVLMFHAGLPAEQLTAAERSLDHADWPARMTRYLEISIQLADAQGISPNRLVLDPGIGFSMTSEESIAVLRQSGCLRALGLPVLHGASRKRLISQILGGREMGERLMGTAATVCYSIVSGADFVRVHDVAEIADVTRVMDALWREGSPT